MYIVAQENNDSKVYLMTYESPRDIALIEANKKKYFIIIIIKLIITIYWVPSVCKALC